jgi:hypothetical protein
MVAAAVPPAVGGQPPGPKRIRGSAERGDGLVLLTDLGETDRWTQRRLDRDNCEPHHATAAGRHCRPSQVYGIRSRLLLSFSPAMTSMADFEVAPLPDDCTLKDPFPPVDDGSR